MLLVPLLENLGGNSHGSGSDSSQPSVLVLFSLKDLVAGELLDSAAIAVPVVESGLTGRRVEATFEDRLLLRSLGRDEGQDEVGSV